MKILIQFPIRERPDRFYSTFMRYYDYADDISNIKFNIVSDKDDDILLKSRMLEIVAKKDNVHITNAYHKSKVHAINDLSEVDMTWPDIILLASDDMIPQIKGYDTIIRNKMLEHYPDTDGVLFFWDGYCDLNTLVIMGRKYFERFNYIYHPDYTSLWCDNEFMEVADRLNKQTRFKDCIIKHEHPVRNKSIKRDNLYNKNESFYKSDKLVYERRKQNNFK